MKQKIKQDVGFCTEGHMIVCFPNPEQEIDLESGEPSAWVYRFKDVGECLSDIYNNHGRYVGRIEGFEISFLGVLVKAHINRRNGIHVVLYKARDKYLVETWVYCMNKESGKLYWHKTLVYSKRYTYEGAALRCFDDFIARCVCVVDSNLTV